MNTADLTDPVQTLSCFFSIKQAQIDHDLRAVEHTDMAAQTIAALGAYDRTPTAELTPQQAADCLHQRLLLVRFIGAHSTASDETVLFSLGVATLAVVLIVHRVALGRGEVAELAEQLQAMRRYLRNGLKDHEYLPLAQRPPEYKAAHQRRELLLGRIYNTAAVDVQRRYRFDDAADLLETNPMKFQVLIEVGRRQGRSSRGNRSRPGMDSPWCDRRMERILRGNFGPAAIHLLDERLRASKPR